MTRAEVAQLREAHKSIGLAYVVLGYMLRVAESEHQQEDMVNTALEQSKGADHDQRSI